MEMSNCSNLGCDQPGNHLCSACKTTPYCGPICQTAHWIHHREECPGHLRKVGMAYLEKAKGFDQARNWPQTLHHANLSATKLKQLKDRPVEDIDKALNLKYHALGQKSISWDGTNRHWNVLRSGYACIPQITPTLLPLKLHSQ